MLPKRPLKDESGSDETSGSGHVKKKPLFSNPYRHPRAQAIHTSICQSIKAPLEQPDVFQQEFTQFRVLIECALQDANYFEVLTQLSKNTKCSLLMDILHLPFVKDELDSELLFSAFCKTELQAKMRCNALLEQMLKTISTKPSIFRQLILTPCVGKSTLQAAIETKSIEVVKTYLKWVGEAIQKNILSYGEVYNHLIMPLGPQNKNILALVNQIGNLPILHELIQFINEVFSEKYAANVILEQLFSGFDSTHPDIAAVRNYFLTHSERAKLIAAQNDATDLNAQLAFERGNFAKHTAMHAQQEQVLEQRSHQLAGEVRELRHEMAGVLRELKVQEQKAQTEMEDLRRALAAEREDHIQITERLCRKLAEERNARQEAQQELTVVNQDYLNLRDEYERLTMLYRSKSNQLADQIAANDNLTELVANLQSHLQKAEAKIDQKAQENRELKAELEDLSIRLVQIQTLVNERDRQEREESLRRKDYGRFYTRPDAPRRDDQEPHERRHPGQGW